MGSAQIPVRARTALAEDLLKKIPDQPPPAKISIRNRPALYPIPVAPRANPKG